MNMKHILYDYEMYNYEMYDYEMIASVASEIISRIPKPEWYNFLCNALISVIRHNHEKQPIM